MRGVFVTGTDTGIGKTVLSAALVAHTKALYWKPVQTGIEQDDDAREVATLANSTIEDVPCYRLRTPVSPHLAAERSGMAIDLEWLTSWCADASDAWVVEGAGGVLVPLTETQLMIDLMARLKLPAVVAARGTLGTINHTLLTLAALRAHDIPVAGVMLIGDVGPGNFEAIEHYGKVRAATMPRFEVLDSVALRSWPLPQWLEEYLL